MNNYLYRYIGFDSFVGMIQKKSLTFILPDIWDDPKENYAFFRFLESNADIYQRMAFVVAHYKTYAQCWTSLAESDAMWRIYSYNNRAIRIKISQKNVEALNNVNAVPVRYKDYIGTDFEGTEEAFLSSLSQKRIAFEHEKEIRLINYYKFLNDDDFKTHIEALKVVMEHPQKKEILDTMFPALSIEEQVQEVCKILNIGSARKVTKDISYSHIPNFIEGVLLHPMAPEWYVEIVREYCSNNNILFEGKSNLYAK